MATFLTTDRIFIFEDLDDQMVRLTITERYPEASCEPPRYHVLSTEILNEAQARFAYEDCARWQQYDIEMERVDEEWCR